MKSFYVSGVTLVLLTVFSCGKQKTGGTSDGAPPKYPTAVVSTGSAELINVYPVTLRGKEDIEIRPRIDGFIDGIYIDEGSAVKQGQIAQTTSNPEGMELL
jgi:membrane fusion protein (multidrug efflux system)